MDCKICGNADNNTTWEVKEMMFGYRDTFAYFQCEECECLQIYDIPENMDKYYPSEYYSLQSPETRQYSSFILNWLKKQRDRSALYNRGVIGNFINSLYPNKILSLISKIQINEESKILDVGCGTGHLLHTLQDFGFKHLLGVDPYIEDDIHYENGLKILKEPIFNVEGKWDLIMFHHSFEHIPNPAEVLQFSSKLLSKDGLCLIRVPTVSSYAWEHYRENWVQLDAPRHFFLHSVKSMKLLASDAHLTLEKTIYDSKAFQFWGSEQYANDIPLRSPNSYGMSKSNSIFTKTEIKDYQKRAQELNKKNRGDTCAFFLRKYE